MLSIAGTQNLGLAAIGITPARRGLLKVNEHFQTALPHVYAVIGFPSLAATSMERRSPKRTKSPR